MPRGQSSIDKEFAGTPTRERGIIGQNWHDMRLKPEPYLETRPRLGHFTRHDEFFKETKRALPMEGAAWQLSMRSGKSTSSFENEAWQHLFQQHEHSFDMLADVYGKKKTEDEAQEGGKPSRPERNRIDPHRERKVHLDLDNQGKEKHAAYTPKVTTNSQRFRGFIESQHTPRRTFGLDHGHDPGHAGPRTHPDACRWMIGLRGGPRVCEEWYDMKAKLEKEEEAKK
eukprot:gnl/MRDRNA2_/MRDRNA2_107228_c0_seq1.p1 gnl/MRDRNA2_/MRDRNA2_107228_c0~~gnl/MRDRNA2_/MRDRNA2_107228_c0_seq1.p1  ORF type:complete len:227 (+),score=45.59 gnl/MRDRNA2_/MRDRNA2_107228_c0_seq1:113-793(+)